MAVVGRWLANTVQTSHCIPIASYIARCLTAMVMVYTFSNSSQI